MKISTPSGSATSFYNLRKVLIQSTQYNVKKVYKIMAIIGVIASVLLFIFCAFDNASHYDARHERYLEHREDGSCGGVYYWEKCHSCEDMEGNPTKIEYAISVTFEEDFIIWLIPVVALVLIGGLIYLWLHSYELTVTDKRIYGKVAWGKRVDLPVDSVSATATIRLLRGVSVSTSSGRISFLVIKNADEIYKVISDLLIKRQQGATATTVAGDVQKGDEADQLKKYKQLLDDGVITQEEFDAKMKQLLGL